MSTLLGDRLLVAAPVRRLSLLGPVLALLPSLVSGEPPFADTISAESLAAMSGSANAPLIVDVRGFPEYKSGHLPGAVNIPHTEVNDHLSDLSVERNGIVLYCSLGERTRVAQQVLIEHQIPNVSRLEGGLRAWREAGQSLRTGWAP